MKLTRLTLVLLIVLVVLLAGGGWLWATHTTIGVPWIKDKVANTPVVNSAVTTNTAVTNTPAVAKVTLPVEVKGDTAFTGTLAVGATTLKISSLSRVQKFADVTAGANNTLLVIYLDPLTLAESQALGRALGRQASLEYQGGTAKPKRYKISSGDIGNDRGYLVFEIPSHATKLFLVYGSGLTAPRVSIPAAS